MRDNTPPGSAARLEGVDESSLEAFRVFRDTMRASGQAMAKRFGAMGVHIGQSAILRALDANDGITQRDVAEMLHIARPTVTSALQTLERDGLVVRKVDEADQRLTRVYLTDEGRAHAEAQRAVLSAYINETIGSMPEEDRRELTRLLSELRDTIERSMPAHGETEYDR